MRHVALMCANHTDLRWSCKSIAYTPGRGYNGQRHIFYIGRNPPHPDGKPVPECDCNPNLLTLAPEDEWYSLSLDEQRTAINND